MFAEITEQQSNYTLEDVNKHVRSTLTNYIVATINDILEFTYNPETRRLEIHSDLDYTFLTLYKQDIVSYANGVERYTDWAAFSDFVASGFTFEVREILIPLYRQMLDIVSNYFEWDDEDITDHVSSPESLWHYYCLSRFEKRIEKMSITSFRRMIRDYEVPQSTIELFRFTNEAESDSDSDSDTDDSDSSNTETATTCSDDDSYISENEVLIVDSDDNNSTCYEDENGARE